MSRFLVGNLFLLLTLICSAVGHIVLKSVVDDVKSEGLSWRAVQLLLSGERFVRTASAGSLVVVGFVFWLMALSRLDLSYAYPIACSSVLLVAFLSAVFLGEPVTARTYLATVLIMVGVILLAPGKS